MSANADRDPSEPGTDASDEPAREREPAPVEPKKKKKKRKKKKAELSAQAPEVRVEAARDPMRARFLESFPSDPQLDRLVAAFETGDYASVRTGASRLAEQTEDPRVRDAALELRRRIEPDPLIRYMLIASVGLLLFMIFYFYSQRP